MTLLAIAYVIFRPLATPRSPPGPARAGGPELVRAHGSDTLSFFKLRGDKHYFFSDDRRAFVGYRIENGVLLLSGDPVGPDVPGLSGSSAPFAEIGASSSARSAPANLCVRSTRRSGCARSTSGDEAIVELDRFSLEGRAIRKVRQSVTVWARRDTPPSCTS